MLTTDPPSLQRGSPTSTNPQLKKKWRRSRSGYGSKMSGWQQDRMNGVLTVGRNITLTLTLRRNKYLCGREQKSCSGIPRKSGMAVMPKQAAVKTTSRDRFQPTQKARELRCWKPLVESRSGQNRRRRPNKQTPWPLVRKRTITTERPPLVDEI
jgi:hypothetical protein